MHSNVARFDPLGKPPSEADGDRPSTLDINDWLRVLIEPGQIFELRAPKATVPGRKSKRTTNLFRRFVGQDEVTELCAAEAGLEMSARAPAVYFTLNPLREGIDDLRAATDADVVRRRLLLIDADPERPADTSSTDAEKAQAFDLVGKVKAFLTERGWPDPVVADSSNGAHLDYLIDLPADDGGLVKRVLETLATRFDTDLCKIDRKVFNPSRICKLYGTISRKGEDTPERPHRISRVVEVPADFKVVPAELLHALVEEKPAGPHVLDLEAEIERKRAGTEPRANGKHQPPDIETRALKYLERCEPAISGQNGHNKAFKAACKIGPGFDLPPETTLRLIRDHFNPRCVPPWSEKELQHKVDDAYRVEERRGWLRDADRNGHRPRPSANGGAATIKLPAAIPEDPVRFRLTDLGNAERLIKLFGHRLRYCPKLGAWLVWDEARWKEDGTGEIFRLAKKTIRTIGAEVAAASSDDEAKAILRWALTSQSKSRIDAMVGLAWNEPGIPVMTDELNRDPYLLNVRNGTLDLKTGELRPHRQEDLITKLAPVRYDSNAECPRFMAFLRRVLPGSEDHPDDLIQFVQRCLGYSLTASIAEHALFFLFGSGRNGKSTLLNVILHLLGDYATTIDVSLLISKHHQDHPTGLTDLDGRRFVPTSEVDEGKRIAEALAKKLTGGERIKARRMREDHYEFDPTHKLFLAVNHEPEIRGTDEGIWSRIKMIPFSVFIPKEERIRDLDKLLVAEEGPGIMAWLVRGCIEWQMRGLDEPKAVIDATDSYRAMMDGLGNFIDEMCECPTEEYLKGKTKTLAKPLFDCYSDWARRNGDEPMTSRRFGSEMERRGYKLDKANSKCWRLGIRIKNVAQERDNASGYF